MTEKQLIRANEIQKELKDLETTLGTSHFTWSLFDGMKNDHPLYFQLEKIATSSEKRMTRLYQDRIDLLKKEFNKL